MKDQKAKEDKINKEKDVDTWTFMKIREVKVLLGRW